MSVNFVTSSADDGVFEKDSRAKNNICAVEGGGFYCNCDRRWLPLYHLVLLNNLYSECILQTPRLYVLHTVDRTIASPF